MIYKSSENNLLNVTKKPSSWIQVYLWMTTRIPDEHHICDMKHNKFLKELCCLSEICGVFVKNHVCSLRKYEQKREINTYTQSIKEIIYQLDSMTHSVNKLKVSFIQPFIFITKKCSSIRLLKKCLVFCTINKKQSMGIPRFKRQYC